MSRLRNAPKRLGKLIDQISERAPSALVVVEAIIPIANDGKQLVAFDAVLPEPLNTRATARKHVVLLDNYTAFPKHSSRTALP
ncbi:MAG TPA: hypothetical protein VGJ91_00060 [Polyangiaceae bacterium]|jgi:hypothetical protein